MSNDQYYDSKPWISYYHNGSQTEPVASQQPSHTNLAALIQSAGHRYATQTAFTTCMPNGMNGKLSYAQVDEMSDAFAVYLRECVQLEAGTRVAVQMPNCLTLPVVAFGILKAGCILVNVNPLYTRREMEHQFNDSDAQALVIIDMFVDKLEDIISNTGIKRVIITSVAQWFPPVVRGVLKLVLAYWNRVIPGHNLQIDTIDQALSKGREAKAAQNLEVDAYWQPLDMSNSVVHIFSPEILKKISDGLA